MKVKEELDNLAGLDKKALEAHLLTLLKDQFELRMKKQSEQLTDTSSLNKVKKSIARVKTIINQK